MYKRQLLHFVISKNNSAHRLSDILQCGPHPQMSLRPLAYTACTLHAGKICQSVTDLVPGAIDDELWTVCWCKPSAVAVSDTLCPLQYTTIIITITVLGLLSLKKKVMFSDLSVRVRESQLHYFNLSCGLLAAQHLDEARRCEFAVDIRWRRVWQLVVNTLCNKTVTNRNKWI